MIFEKTLIKSFYFDVNSAHHLLQTVTPQISCVYMLGSLKMFLGASSKC